MICKMILDFLRERGKDMKVDREVLEEKMIRILPAIKPNKKLAEQYKSLMSEFKVPRGATQLVLNEPENRVPELTTDELFIYSLQLYRATGIQELNPDHHFNEREQKEIKTTFEVKGDLIIEFPYVFKDTKKLHDGYSTAISVTDLRGLNNGKEIQYNPNVQRSGKVNELDDGTIIPVPKLFRNNVNQIKRDFMKGELESTTLLFNARLGSSDNGEELIYNEDTRELIVTEGTLFDILDGFHRFTGTIEGQLEKPEANMEFMVKIKNVTEKEAKKTFMQINTFHVVNRSRKQELDEESFSSVAVNMIKRSSEIKDKITSDSSVGGKGSDVLTSFGILADAVEEFFNIENRGQAIQTGQYLASFFDEMAMAYPNEFLGDVAETRKTSIINRPIMFHGYIYLAKRMQDHNISVDNVGSILSDIDFNRENWTELSEISPSKLKNYIKEYIDSIELEDKTKRVGV